MIDYSLQSYWVLVRGHRGGDEACFLALELLAYEPGRAGRAATLYCLRNAA